MQLEFKPEEARATSVPHRWSALALICAASFMTVLDGSIVNVALPKIQHELGFSTENLQWIVTGYSVTFGCFLLFGGRASDLFGRRRLFLTGIGTFTIASLICGLTPSQPILIAARLAQGIGGALLAPAALSLLATLFKEGRERNRALGIYSSMAALGAAAGALLGGLFTSTIGWRWVFFVNVPLGALVFVLAILLLPESRAALQNRKIDVGGTFTITLGLATLVYTISIAGNTRTSGLLVILLSTLAVILLASFVYIERSSPVPLLRLGIFRLRMLTGANILGLLYSGLFAAIAFLITLYMQQVLNYSPLQAGLAFLPVTGIIIIAAASSGVLLSRFGVKQLLIVGIFAMGLGLFLLTHVSTTSQYVSGILPGLLITGLGFGISINVMTVAAVTGVQNDEQGLASGLINTTNQIGTAIIVALLAAAYAVRTQTLAGSLSQKQAAVAGYATAFEIGIGLLVLAMLVAITVIPQQRRVLINDQSERMDAIASSDATNARSI